MLSLLVFLAVAALSVLASSRTALQAGRFFGLAQLSASGLSFLVLGAALGPSTAGALKASDLEQLRPLYALGLGFGGLMIGLNLDLRVLRRLPAAAYKAASAHSVLAFLFVAAPLTGVLYTLTSLTVLGAIGAASLLGAAASISSAHLAVLWSRTGRLDRLRGLSVSVLTMLDDLTGLIVLAVALVFGASSEPGAGLGLVLVAVVLGLFCGALIAYLIHRTLDTAEVMAVLIGSVALVSGAAAYLRVSALLAGLFCGAVLSLLGGKTVELVFRTLARIERPAYLVLVFLIGALVDLRSFTTWLILPAFVALRFLGKVAGGRLAAKVAGDALALPPRLGYALLAQGGVSLCLLTDYLLLVPGEASQLVSAVGVAAAVVNEIVASRTFGYSLEPVRPAAAAGGSV